MSPLKQGILSVLIVLAAAAGWYVYKSPETVGLAREGATTSGEPGARPAGGREGRIPGLIGSGGTVNVITAAVETEKGGERVVALGTAKAAHSVTLYPQETGMVADIQFKPGDRIEKGALLLRLDDDSEQVAADRARIEYAQATAALERSQALAKSKTISSVALSDAEMAAHLAENGVRTAEIAVNRRLIKAPFAGIVGLTDISIGDLVTNSTAITTLDDLSTIRVGFEVPERWAPRIQSGQAITASAQGLPGSDFEGRIVGIDNRIDEATRTLRLEAELSNPNEVLKAGMAITVALEFSSAEELSVPSLAVQWDRRGSYVWKVLEGAARRGDVAVVKRESGVVIVNGDLQAGDRVVVEGTQRLREGAMVAEVNESPAIADEIRREPIADEVPAVSGAGTPPKTRG